MQRLVNFIFKLLFSKVPQNTLTKAGGAAGVLISVLSLAVDGAAQFAPELAGIPRVGTEIAIATLPINLAFAGIARKVERLIGLLEAAQGLKKG